MSDMTPTVTDNPKHDRLAYDRYAVFSFADELVGHVETAGGIHFARSLVVTTGLIGYHQPFRLERVKIREFGYGVDETLLMALEFLDEHYLDERERDWSPEELLKRIAEARNAIQ